jgi:hypothetical protein
MPMATKEEQRRYQREWVARHRQEYLKDKFCVRCGSKEELRVHHKDRNLKVSHSIWSWSEIRRKTELAKCEILCQTCHVEHHRQDGAYQGGKGKIPTNAKLNSTIVKEIRNLSLSGSSNRDIARLLIIPRQTVDDVISRRSWKMV